MTQPTLSFDDVNDIVDGHLLLLDRTIYQVTPKNHGRSRILYTITEAGEFLGGFLVAVDSTGKAGCSPKQLKTPEMELLWEAIWVTIERAKGTATPEFEEGIQRLAEYHRQQIQAIPPKPEKPPKQKGRYRLTPEDIKQRKNIVRQANRIRRENPGCNWKWVAQQLDHMSDRTLRDWRHNPKYQ